MRRQSAPTNATPSPLARLDECPHRDAQLRSAARHCHPPITRPSFMSRLERIRTLPVVYGGNRAALLLLSPSSGRRSFRCDSIVHRWPKNRRGQAAGLKREIIRSLDSGALARLGTPSAGAVCRAAEIPRLRSRFVDGLLPLACGQSVHNCSMRTTARGVGPALFSRFLLKVSEPLDGAVAERRYRHQKRN